MLRYLSVFLVVVGFAQAAQAVSFRDKDMEDRFIQLEEKVNRMEQGGGANSGDAASMQVQMDEIRQEMTKLRGAIEESNHRSAQVEQTVNGLSKDVDFRLRALEQAGAANGAAAGGPVVNMGDAPAAPAVAPNAAPATPAAPVAPTAEAAKPAAATAPAVEAGQSFASSKEHYNYAFSLMNKARYEEAGNAFDAFIKKYPSDPLVGNVYYWLGETWYVRTNYVKAADSFRQGFEAMPKGNKAPDNLLKLAMALGQMKQQKQACVVLTQLLKKFPGPEIVRTRATREQEKQGCEKAAE